MKNNDHTKKNMLRELLVESKLEMPFDDFEAKVMQSIHQELNEKKVIRALLIKSWLFFVLGLILGVLSPNIISYLQLPEQVNEKLVSLIFQIVISLVCLFFLERLISFSIKTKR